MTDNSGFQAIRRTARVALTDRNRDERYNELVALQIQTEAMSPATIYDPEDWAFYHQAQKRIRDLRQFLKPCRTP